MGVHHDRRAGPVVGGGDAFTPVPAIPSTMSATNMSTIGSGTSVPSAWFSAGPRCRKKNGTLS